MNCMTALTAIGVDHGVDQGALVPHLHNYQQQGVPQIQASELGSEDGHGGPVAPGSLPQHPQQMAQITAHLLSRPLFSPQKPQ